MMKKKNKNTGIHLEGRIPDQRDYTENRGFFWFVPVFYMILGLYGWVRTALSVGAFSADERILCAAVLFLGLWFGIIYRAGRWKFVLFLVSAGAAGLLVWKNFALLQEGFLHLGEAFLQSSGADHGSYTGWQTEVTAAMSAVIFLLYCIFVGCLHAEAGKYLVIVCLAVPVGAAFVFGQVPDGIGVFCMLFSAIGLIVSSADERDILQEKSALLTGFLCLLLLAAGFAFSEPVLGSLFEQKEETRNRILQTSLLKEMTERFSSWQSAESTVASGGVSDGTFNNTDFFQNTGEILFSVAQDQKPEGNLYLRVYTGFQYTKAQWTEDKDTRFPSDIFYERAEEAAFVNGYDSPVSLSVGFPEGKEDREHPFSPYFSTTQGEVDGRKQYRFYPMWCLGEMFSLSGDDSMDAYRDYVYGKYLDYPQKRLPRLQEFVETHPCSDLEEICSTVKELLYENASYNPQTGRFPEDEDFAEYFLFEQKEGYCVHFATTAVLLMRMYGIPARYVTGFAIPSGDFEWTDGIGWLANVQDGRAHAWAEIYVDHYGWIPFETTPSYDTGAALVYSQEAREQIKGQSLPEDSGMDGENPETAESDKKETDGTGEETGSDSGKTDREKGNHEDKNIVDAGSTGIGVAGVGLLLLVFGMIGLFLRREMILKRRSRQDAAAIFRDMYQVLVQGGMPEGTDCMAGDFTAKVTEQFLWIDKEEMDLVMDIVMRANFSGEAIGKEEVLQVRSMYRHICRTIQKGMSWQKKFYFRFIKVYA